MEEREDVSDRRASWSQGGMEVDDEVEEDDDDDDYSGPSNAVVLHEDKKYYPEVYDPLFFVLLDIWMSMFMINVV